MLWLWAFLCLARSPLSYAQSPGVNVTVDDSSSQIIYSPEDAWRNGAFCHECRAQPSTQLAHQGSWHDGLFTTGRGTESAPTHSLPDQLLFANFSFTGSAIYAFGITFSSRHDPDASASLYFRIDDELVGSFLYAPTGGDNYEYNVPLYSNSSMPEGEHVFSLQNGPTAVPSGESLVLLDYLTFTRFGDNPSSPTNSTPGPSAIAAASKSNPVAIAGGVLGGLTFLLLLALLLLVWHRRRRQRPLLPLIQRSKTGQSLPYLNPISWFANQTPGRKPVTFNPDMMVAPSREATPAMTGPPGSSSQNRIMAWQRQTAQATSDTPRRTTDAPRSERLSSYWDQSTESYRSWHSRPDSGVPAGPPPEKQSPARAPSPVTAAASPVGSPTLPPPPPPPQAQLQTPRTPRRATRRFTVMNN